MGSPNPDRVPISRRRARCETVSDMLRDRWDVISACERCGLAMRVDLNLLVQVKGPHLSLWNRKARCRRIGCQGWVVFQARAPRMAFHEVLRAE